MLGETLPEIAREKAGILKPGVPAISGVTQDEARSVVREIARQRGCPLEQLHDDIRVRYYRPEKCGEPHLERGIENGFATIDVQTPFASHTGIPLPLAGKHQAANAALALAAVDRLRANGRPISEAAILKGMSAVNMPVRLEVLGRNPTVIVDAAHNGASAQALSDTLCEEFPAKRRILVFAVSRDKDVVEIARILYPVFDEIVLTAFVGNPRAIPAEELHDKTCDILDQTVHVASYPADAWRIARNFATADDVICATGSFYLAAEMRHIILRDRNTPNPTVLQLTSNFASPI